MAVSTVALIQPRTPGAGVGPSAASGGCTEQTCGKDVVSPSLPAPPKEATLRSKLANAGQWIKDHPGGTMACVGVGIAAASPLFGFMLTAATGFPPRGATWTSIAYGLGGAAANVAGYAALMTGHPVLGAMGLIAGSAAAVHNYVDQGLAG